MIAITVFETSSKMLLNAKSGNFPDRNLSLCFPFTLFLLFFSLYFQNRSVFKQALKFLPKTKTKLLSFMKIYTERERESKEHTRGYLQIKDSSGDEYRQP